MFVLPNMKMLEKNYIFKLKLFQIFRPQQNYKIVFELKKIVKNLNHNFITNIKLCFETSNRIYFCFEYVQNEDLFHHINYKANSINNKE